MFQNSSDRHLKSIISLTRKSKKMCKERPNNNSQKFKNNKIVSLYSQESKNNNKKLYQRLNRKKLLKLKQFKFLKNSQPKQISWFLKDSPDNQDNQKIINKNKISLHKLNQLKQLKSNKKFKNQLKQRKNKKKLTLRLVNLSKKLLSQKLLRRNNKKSKKKTTDGTMSQ